MKKEKELDSKGTQKVNQLTDWLISDLKSDGLELNNEAKHTIKNIINIAYMQGYANFQKS